MKKINFIIMVIMMAFVPSLLLLSCGGAGDSNGSDTIHKTEVISDSDEEPDNTIIIKAQDIIQKKLIDVDEIPDTKSEYRKYINDSIATPIKGLLKDTKKEHQNRYLDEILDYKSLDALNEWRKTKCLPVLKELIYNNANNIDEVREEAEKANKGVEDLKVQVGKVEESLIKCNDNIAEIKKVQSELENNKIGWTQAMICAFIGVIISMLIIIFLNNKLKAKINRSNQSGKPDSGKNLTEIEKRLKELEDKLNKLTKSQLYNTPPLPIQNHEPIVKPENEIAKNKIDKSPKNKIDKSSCLTEYIGDFESSTLYGVSKEDNGSMYFKVYWKDENKTEGEISLIDLERVRSNDSVQKYYIESTGCSFGVARDYREIAKGKIIKGNGGWELKEKIKIILHQ